MSKGASQMFRKGHLGPGAYPSWSSRSTEEKPPELQYRAAVLRLRAERDLAASATRQGSVKRARRAHHFVASFGHHHRRRTARPLRDFPEERLCVDETGDPKDSTGGNRK